MSDPDTAPGASHDDHADGHGDGPDAGRQHLGPVDVEKWAYALAGAAVGLIVWLSLLVASGT